MINSGKKISIVQIISILIISPDIPSVIIRNGRVIVFKTGFIKKLTIPKTDPAIIRYLISPMNCTPGTNFVASHRERTPAMI